MKQIRTRLRLYCFFDSRMVVELDYDDEDIANLLAGRLSVDRPGLQAQPNEGGLPASDEDPLSIAEDSQTNVVFTSESEGKDKSDEEDQTSSDSTINNGPIMVDKDNPTDGTTATGVAPSVAIAAPAKDHSLAHDRRPMRPETGTGEVSTVSIAAPATGEVSNALIPRAERPPPSDDRLPLPIPPDSVPVTSKKNKYRIIGHAGPFHEGNVNYCGSSYSMLMAWEEGFRYVKAHVLVAKDDPEAFVEYAFANRLENHPAWIKYIMLDTSIVAHKMVNGAVTVLAIKESLPSENPYSATWYKLDAICRSIPAACMTYAVTHGILRDPGWEYVKSWGERNSAKYYSSERAKLRDNRKLPPSEPFHAVLTLPENPLEDTETAQPKSKRLPSSDMSKPPPTRNPAYGTRRPGEKNKVPPSGKHKPLPTPNLAYGKRNLKTPNYEEINTSTDEEDKKLPPSTKRKPPPTPNLSQGKRKYEEINTSTDEEDKKLPPSVYRDAKPPPATRASARDDKPKKIRTIVNHEGPLTNKSRNYKRCSYNIYVVWDDDGLITLEPLNKIKDIAPTICASYASDRGLLNTLGWKSLRDFLPAEKAKPRVKPKEDTIIDNRKPRAKARNEITIASESSSNEDDGHISPYDPDQYLIQKKNAEKREAPTLPTSVSQILKQVNRRRISSLAAHCQSLHGHPEMRCQEDWPQLDGFYIQLNSIQSNQSGRAKSGDSRKRLKTQINILYRDDKSLQRLRTALRWDVDEHEYETNFCTEVEEFMACLEKPTEEMQSVPAALLSELVQQNKILKDQLAEKTERLRSSDPKVSFEREHQKKTEVTMIAEKDSLTSSMEEGKPKSESRASHLKSDSDPTTSMATGVDVKEGKKKKKEKKNKKDKKSKRQW